MIDIKPAALAAPATDSVRLIAMDLLLQAAAAIRQLSDPPDPDALHDFRVALRRLRSTVRAYRPALADRVPRRLRRRLREIAAATNAGRDADVLLAWAKAKEAETDRTARAALVRLTLRLEERRREARHALVEDVARRFGKLERQLARRLSVPGPAGETAPTLAELAAAAAQRHGTELREALGEVHSATDGAAAHRARIAAKRLRYLLEPLRGAVPGAPQVVKRLKRLQDEFGRFQDLRTLAEEARTAVVDEAAARAGRLFDRALDREGPAAPRPRRASYAGLLAIAALVRAEQRGLFAEIERTWLGTNMAELCASIEEVVAALTRAAPGAHAQGPSRRPPRRARARKPSSIA